MAQPAALDYASPSPSTRPTANWSAAALIVATASLGFAIHLKGGEYTPTALLLVTISIATCIQGLFLGNSQPTDRASRWTDYFFGTALAAQFLTLLFLWPVGVDQIYQSLRNHIVYLYLMSVSAGLVLLAFANLPSMRRWWFPALLVMHFMLGLWTIRSAPTPHIDVWYFQGDGPAALLHGRNPYDASQVNFPDIYQSTHENHQRVYGPGMVVDDTLQFGFPYPPLSLYCSTLGYVIGADTRYAQAAALTLAGLLIGHSQPGRRAKLAAALFLFTPTEWFVLGRAWTEPFVVMFLAATIFCASRKLRWLMPVAFGLFICSKQYLAFAVPLSFLLVDDFNFRQRSSWIAWAKLLAGAGIVAAIVTAPMALRDFHAYWFSTVTVQAVAPFRWDALSYLVWLGFHFDSKYTTWLWPSFVAAGLAIGLSICRAKRTPAGFAAAMALTYLVFIAFNKQAFCNYYFFVIGCLSCAIGESDSTDRSQSMED